MELKLLEKAGQNQYEFRKKYVKDSYSFVSELAKHNVMDLIRPLKTPPLDEWMDK